MKPFKKRLIGIIILIIFGLCASVYAKKLYTDATIKEGDIIFQISKSRQSLAVQWATGSIYSHCGVIVEKEGEFYVLEASNVVKLTPYKEWCKRGRFGYYTTRRITDNDIKIEYDKYLGIPYDLAFKFHNGKYYCSELVLVIYKEQFNIEICEPRPVKEYNIDRFKELMEKRNISEDQLVVAPSDLL